MAATTMRQSGFLFCEICGTMLCFNSRKYAECPLCKSKEKAKDIVGKEISYTVTEEQIRRELGLSTLVVTTQKIRSTDHNVRCPKCSKLGVHYHTQQTRSADEGQTLFYDCPSCGHSFTENS